MPKISVIVPVYNTERYLSKCIDSILSQSFTDFELLLINDGSKDNSGTICDQYAVNDSRVRVFHKENGGVSSARNLGLENARGEWVTFVDSDDWIYEQSLMQLILHSCESNLIIGSIYFECSNKKLNLLDMEIVLRGKELFECFSNRISNIAFNSPCAKLFNRTIINENCIRFDEALRFGEDAVFVKSYLLNITSVSVVNFSCYHYCDSGDNIYRKYAKSFESIYSYFNKMQGLYKDIENKYNISISRKELVDVVFNLAMENIKLRGLYEWSTIRLFLRCDDTKINLRKRQSLHINILLFLAKFGNGVIFYCYFYIVQALKYMKQR